MILIKLVKLITHKCTPKNEKTKKKNLFQTKLKWQNSMAEVFVVIGKTKKWMDSYFFRQRL